MELYKDYILSHQREVYTKSKFRVENFLTHLDRLDQM